MFADHRDSRAVVLDFVFVRRFTRELGDLVDGRQALTQRGDRPHRGPSAWRGSKESAAKSKEIMYSENVQGFKSAAVAGIRRPTMRAFREAV